MISDTETNKVYFSKYLTAYKCWANIKATLEAKHIPYNFLPNTEDIWVRDFMPVQLSSDSFVSYIYHPDYLEEERQYETKDVFSCYNFQRKKIKKLNLVIDGGNVIKCGEKLIMTRKVFDENDSLTKPQITKMIEEAFQSELIIIPWDTAEEYGHADGMVRYIGKDHILLNHYADFDESLHQEILHALQPHFTMIDELEYGKNWRSKSWAHLNFLQIGKHVLVPQLDIASDNDAVSKIKIVFGSDYDVVGIETKGIVRRGGALNCVSWNICE